MNKAMKLNFSNGQQDVCLKKFFDWQSIFLCESEGDYG